MHLLDGVVVRVTCVIVLGLGVVVAGGACVVVLGLSVVGDGSGSGDGCGCTVPKYKLCLITCTHEQTFKK